MNNDSPTYHLKSGLRKVYKVDFNQNPERYELRAQDVDAPACPYGNEYAWIGYDLEMKEYVRLVKSILRDERLRRVTIE